MLDLERLVGRALDLGAEFVEIRWQRSTTNRLFVVDGVIRELNTGIVEGVGIRALVGGAWGFATVHGGDPDAVERALKEAVRLAKASAQMKSEKFRLDAPSHQGSWSTRVRKDPSEVDVEGKIRFALDLNDSAKRVDPRVKNVNVGYADTHSQEEIVNSLGTRVRQETVRTRAAVQVFAHEAGITERAFESVGGLGGFEVVEAEHARGIGEAAASRAVEFLSAKSAPAGPFRAILDPKLAGVFIHEAFGHACEADEVLAKMSILEGKIGTRVGREIVNVVDDPTIPGLYGSYAYDSEGSPAKKKYLVKEGVLNSFMHNLETSSRMGVSPTGNGRATDYSYPPIVRMSNTFIEPGDWTLEEMLSEVKEGIYAEGSLYGYTDPAKGEFVFKAEGGWLIKNGEFVERLREVAITGTILEILHNISAVGRDLKYDPGACGKFGQWVPVTTGSPHVLVERVVFGGMR